MNKFRNSVVASAGLLIFAITLTEINGHRAAAQGQGGGKVSQIMVHDAYQPIQADLYPFGVNPGTTSVSVAIFNVPAANRLVIEYISGGCRRHCASA